MLDKIKYEKYLEELRLLSKAKDANFENKDIALPDETKYALIEAYINSVAIKEKSFFKVKACAGSGKTTLIISTILALLSQGEVDPDEIAILSFNKRISDEINRRLADALSLEKEHKFAYTFHSFANRFLKNNKTYISETLTSSSSKYSENLYYVLQSKILDLKYLSNPDFAEKYDNLNALLPDKSFDRGTAAKLSNKSLTALLKHIGLKTYSKKTKSYDKGASNSAGNSPKKKNLICDLKKRLNPDFLEKHTLRGDILLDQNGNELDSNFKQRIHDVANRLSLKQICYDFEIYAIGNDLRCIISINLKTDDFNETRYIEICAGNKQNQNPLYKNSLLIDSDLNLNPRDWTAFNETTSVDVFDELDEFLSDTNLKGFNLDELGDIEEKALLYRPADEISKILALVVDRLRNQRLCSGSNIGEYKVFLSELISNLEKKLEDQANENINGRKKKKSLSSDEIFCSFLKVLLSILDSFMGFGEEEVPVETYSKILEEIIDSFKPTEASQRLKNLKHIFVDEAQDLNELFADIIEILAKLDCKIFFVGDSMQSINRFAGSNVDIFNNLDDRFHGIEIKKFELPITYRLNSNLVDFVNAFTETWIGDESLLCKMQAFAGNNNISENDGIYANHELCSSNSEQLNDELIEVCADIISKAWAENTSYKIALLARSNAPVIGGKLSLIRSRVISKLETKSNYSIDILQNIIISSLHRFKGEEADIVIILDANSGVYPFESDTNTKNINEYLFGENDKIREMDNLCLFYVAITRAKRQLHFIYDNLTSYIKEVI